jgi:hypothetical protein
MARREQANMSPSERFRTSRTVLGESSDALATIWSPEIAIEVLGLFTPGTHTVELSVDRSMKRHVWKTFGDCTATPLQNDQLLVGWEQIELDGDPCFAATTQIAVQFNTSLLDNIEDKVVNQAVLVYDEVGATGCFNGGSCWTSGDGQPENKPDGCVVVRIPSTDWVDNPPNGEFPCITSGRPAVNRLGVREWDVTEPFLWQTQPGAMPLSPPDGPGFIPGFGFLLTGGLTIDQLEAEDNTNCLSELSHIRLRTTYTISEGVFHPPN